MNSFLLLFILSMPSVFASSEDLRQELHEFAKKNHKSLSYSRAREALFNKLYLEKDEKGYFIRGVYCAQKYYPFGGNPPKNRIPDHNVFNTEHTWPQSKFTNRFKTKSQKTDLHHLFPTFSKINSERGSLPFAEVNARRNLSCSLPQSGTARSGGSGTYFEPPDSQKGNTARAMFYFSIRYHTNIDSTQENYLRIWHKEDPVDQSEKSRHELISRLQGNRNPFIDRPELVNSISDF